MAIAAAGIGAASSLLSGITAGKGAKKAAKIQAQVAREQLAQQQAQFNTTQTNIQPYVGAGNAALGAQQTLLGLGSGGSAGQQAAFDALKASPAFTALYGTGQDTILQNAAATGGLRGGDTQNSLANFGSSLLAQVIQNQLSNLGGISSLGANAAAGLASAGQANANASSAIIGNAGQAASTNALTQGAISGGMISGISGALQQYLASRTGAAPVSTAYNYNTPGYNGGWTLGGSVPGSVFNSGGLNTTYFGS